jgi:hypothetical protein
MVNVAGVQDLVLVERKQLVAAMKATENAASCAKQAGNLCGQARQSFMTEATRLDTIAEALRAAM